MSAANVATVPALRTRRRTGPSWGVTLPNGCFNVQGLSLLPCGTAAAGISNQMKCPNFILRWLDKHQGWVKSALQWPLIWQLAARYAATLPHEQVDEICLPCLARTRRARDVHKAKMDSRRQIICAKCGVPMTEWGRKPLCRGLKSYVPPAAPKATGPLVKLVNWE